MATTAERIDPWHYEAIRASGEERTDQDGDAQFRTRATIERSRTVCGLKTWSNRNKEGALSGEFLALQDRDPVDCCDGDGTASGIEFTVTASMVCRFHEIAQVSPASREWVEKETWEDIQSVGA